MDLASSDLPYLPDVPAKSGSAVMRIALGAHLRRLRESAGISADGAAYEIRGSRSKISRIENGRVSLKDRDVHDLLILYGVTDERQIASIRELATHANAQEWWAKHSDVLPGWFEPYLGLESSATVIRSFDLQFVNGLFQVEPYARAVASVGMRAAAAEEIERRVSVRMKRQELLTSPDAPKVWSIMDEAALRRPVGGPEVMRQQLQHLADVARLPNVTLQVVPFHIGAHDGAGGSFTVLRFAAPDVCDVVYIEQLTGAQYLDKRADVDHYLAIINRLGAMSLNPARSIRFFTDTIRQV